MPQAYQGVPQPGFNRLRPGCAASAAARASARTADAVACPVSRIRAAGIPRAPGSCCRRTAPVARPVAARALAPERLPLPRAVGGWRSDPRRALGQACGPSLQTPCAAAARAGRLARRLRPGRAMLPCRARRVAAPASRVAATGPPRQHAPRLPIPALGVAREPQPLVPGPLQRPGSAEAPQRPQDQPALRMSCSTAAATPARQTPPAAATPARWRCGLRARGCEPRAWDDGAGACAAAAGSPVHPRPGPAAPAGTHT